MGPLVRRKVDEKFLRIEFLWPSFTGNIARAGTSWKISWRVALTQICQTSKSPIFLWF
jgi:hypothetical protein